MNFLNKSYYSLVELFKSMTPAARVTSGIMLIAIIASMFYLFQFQLSAGTVFIYGGQEFSQGEIGQMETAFAKSALNDYTVVGNRVKIPLSSRDLYTKALAENDAVPNSIISREDSVVSSNPFMSQAAQSQAEKQQKTNKIRSMIMASPKINNASVEYDEVLEGAPFREMRRTCAIGIHPVGSYQLIRDDFVSIQRIAKNALAGIKDSDITIVDHNSGNSHTGDSIAAGANESLLIREKKRYEHEYEQKIREQLMMYPGAVVGVDVDIDPTIGSDTYEKTLSTGTTIKQSTEKQNLRSSTGGNGGAPGVRSNGPASANASGSLADVRQTTNDITKEESTSLPGGSIQHTQLHGLTVRSARVSIGVPQSTVQKLFMLENPATEGAPPTPIDYTKLLSFFEERIKKPISEKVRLLIKPTDVVGQDPYDAIVVQMDPDIPMEKIPGPALSDTAITWLSANWQNLGLMGFGLFAVAMLRSMVGTAVRENDAADAAEKEFGGLLPPELGDDDEVEEVIVETDGTTRIVKKKRGESEEEKAKKANELLKRFQSREPTLREELTELVEADLDAAAEVLRSWIGEIA